MMNPQLQILVSGLEFPEGPVFDHKGQLWFVEIKGQTICCWDGLKLIRFQVNGTPNGAMVDHFGKIWFCDSERGEIRQFDPQTHAFKTMCNCLRDGTPLKRPNDLIFDSAGNLLFSDHADGRQERLSTICVLPKGASESLVISSNKLFTNGLALSKNGKKLIFSETYNQQLWVGHWDPVELKLENECLFAKAGEGPWGPDGIAFDDNENLYVTIFNESKINIYSPAGELTGEIKCPGSRPTSCTFDPSGKLGLVITEAERGEVLSMQGVNKGLPIFYG
jgi:gluconolactonase